MQDEEKELDPKVSLNNSRNELYDEESHVVHKLIRARRVALPNNGEDWEILEDNRVVVTVKGLRLSKKEKQFLYTPDGIKYLIEEYKSGNNSVSGIKKKLKQKIND